MIVLKTAEWILTAGGFGLVVIDCAAMPDFNGRLPLHAERGAAPGAWCGTQRRRRAGTRTPADVRDVRRAEPDAEPQSRMFQPRVRGAPVLFDGLTVEARVTRNKLGGSGDAVTWNAMADPPIAILPESAPSPHSSHSSESQTAPSAARRIAAR